MAEYEILIFMSEGKLRAAQIGTGGVVEPIHFQGDNDFKYVGEKELDDFYASITDTYNVDDLSDLDAEVFLVDCGVPEKKKWYLLEKMRSCASWNTVTLQKVFPMLLTKKGCCNPSQKTVAEFLGKKYAFFCDDNCLFEEISAKGEEVGVTLDIEDFSFLAVFNGQAFSSGGSVAAEKLLNEKEKEMTGLRLEIERLEGDNRGLQSRIQELQTEVDQCRKELEKKEKESKNKSSEKMISRRRVVLVECQTILDMILNIQEDNGKIVTANQKIAGLRPSRDGTYDTNEVFASRDGKIVWLSLNGDPVKCGQIVAVIGDQQDDEEEMIAWGRQERAKEKNEDYIRLEERGNSTLGSLLMKPMGLIR